MNERQDILRKFAELIADYCIEVRETMEVLVNVEYPGRPLAEELYKVIVDRGGYPRIHYTDSSLQEYFYKNAPIKLLEYRSRIDEFIAENIDASVRILAPDHSKPLSSVDPERIKTRAQANRKISEIIMKRDAMEDIKWVVTAYPTNAMAQEAGFSPLEWREFVYRAIKLYSHDPVEEWKKQTAMQEKIIRSLEKIDEYRIVGEGTDLTLKTSGRKWINDDGKNNMPGGEVFTAPVDDSAEGTIVFTYPAIWRGVEVENVKLVFRRGTVVDAKATKGEEFLRKMLETDEGAKKLGEFAFGLNNDITRFTKEILFDEKMGGTIHLALGAAYPRCGGTNRSSIHWDMIKDMRKGKIFGDGELIYNNGSFIRDVL